MAHETNNATHSDKDKTIISFKSSFWLIVIIVGLFIAALNFIKVMGNGEEGNGGKKEASGEMQGTKSGEATESNKMTEEPKPAAAAPQDTAHKEAH